jgi:hypothetical protein
MHAEVAVDQKLSASDVVKRRQPAILNAVPAPMKGKDGKSCNGT